MKKRLISILVALAVVASAFSGCNTDDGGSSTAGTASSGAESVVESSAASEEEASSEASEKDADEDKETPDGEVEELTVMVWDRGNAAPNTSNEDNPLTDYIKERVLEEANVDVSYMIVPRSGSDDKLNVMMAGGNAPGIVFSYDQAIFTNYAANGGLADLTDAMDTYGDQIREYIGEVQHMGEFEGKQYAVMKQRADSASRHVQYIRKDWLDKLGMEVPSTKEELFKALHAFKDENPGEVANPIPWMMSGVIDTEKNYLNFVGSYTAPFDDSNKKEQFVYSENYIIFREGGIEGIRKMNELYNDGLIYNDFVSDTTEDMLRQEISNGNVGFVLADRTWPWEFFEPMQEAVPGAEFEAVSTLELSDGSYRNPAEPLHGMFVMVPENRSDMANAAMRYLNWMADPQVAEDISYTPGHEVTPEGVPIRPLEDELHALGYPGTPADLDIINDHLPYTETRDGLVTALMLGNAPFAERPWYEHAYDIIYEDGYFVYDSYPAVIEAEAEYGANVKNMAVEYVYKLICCAPEEFDALQKTEYDKLVSAGLEKIFEERAAWYDENVG